MKKVGEVSEIWRYPVKGMAGEMLQASQLGARGLRGDRIWAVRDTLRREIQSCKFRPELLRCAARVAADAHSEVEIIFPDGNVLDAADARAHARVTELIGHASTIEALRPATDLDFYRRHKSDDHSWMTELRATFEREAGEPLPAILDKFPPAAADFVVLPGSFFLVTPLHLLTTGSLTWMQSINPAADWQSRRFRPNVVVDTGRRQGLVEQAWIGRQIMGRHCHRRLCRHDPALWRHHAHAGRSGGGQDDAAHGGETCRPESRRLWPDGCQRRCRGRRCGVCRRSCIQHRWRVRMKIGADRTRRGCPRPRLLPRTGFDLGARCTRRRSIGNR